ncbi:uncharacterized protein LOC122306322 [Carya illinoinensis]|uniref:uncharacterized protein LOC122306322 n=1 Tax=Carya illinoinensis TaxID=32201 RepID=UPI001C71D23E|nr:uncharacterized protein LOC122306322 [Carya illinoinensis]
MAESSVSSNTDDSSPFQLQNGDSPGSILVSNLLTGDNYNSWRRSMEMALKAKNKLGFVNGSIIQPHETDSTYSKWDRCNSMVLLWILNSVSCEIGEIVVYALTAKDMWDELNNQFSQGNEPRIFQLQKELSSLSQDQTSVSVYYRKFKCLWDELINYDQIPHCTCGAYKSCKCDATRLFLAYQQRQHVISFLMALNDDFTHVRGQILLLEPLPSITKVFSLIIQEEKQKEVSSMGRIGFEPNVAFMNKRIESSKPNSGKQFRKEKLLCTHCGMTNHTVDKCYKLHRYPPNFRSRGKVSSANQVLVQPESTPFDSNCMSFSQDEYQQLLALIRPQATDSSHHQAANIISEIPFSSV